MKICPIFNPLRRELPPGHTVRCRDCHGTEAEHDPRLLTLPELPLNPQVLGWGTLPAMVQLTLGNNSYQWAKQTRVDWLMNRRVWREVPVAMFMTMLECVPPRCHTGDRFMVGEANDHTRSGEGTYSAFIIVAYGDRVWNPGPDARVYTMHQTMAEHRSRQFDAAPRLTVPPTLEITDEEIAERVPHFANL